MNPATMPVRAKPPAFLSEGSTGTPVVLGHPSRLPTTPLVSRGAGPPAGPPE